VLYIGLTLCFISLWLPDDGYVTFNRRELDSPEPIQA
jgi:hypothetical protein